jgi:hypothetical protein
MTAAKEKSATDARSRRSGRFWIELINLVATAGKWGTGWDITSPAITRRDHWPFAVVDELS